MTVNKVISGFVVLFLLTVMFLPIVQAAETRNIEGWIRIDPDLDEMIVSMTWNASDPSNTILFNWNQTVDYFQKNNSLNGSFTGTFMPPIEFKVTEYDEFLTLLGLVKFKSTWIMSGSTESWWRIPCQGPGWGDSTNLTIWHIDSPATLDIEDSGIPNNISHPMKVFDQPFTMNSASLNKTVRYWNGTAWDRSFNSTWVHVGAQIHTDEFYLIRWVIHNPGADPYLIRFSSTDQCDDRVFNTWVIKDDGTKEVYEADLDYSVLHVLGMGYSVWGHEIEKPDDDSVKITWNTELDHAINEGEYLTVMVPFLDIVDNSTNVRIGFGTQNDSWGTFWWVAENGPTDFGLKSVQWDVAWGSKDMKVTMTIYNRSRSIWIMDTNPEFDPDWTWSLNRYTVDDHEWAPDDYYFGGTPYHSCQITNGSWENTQPTESYFLKGREVYLDQIMKKRQDSNHWLLIFYLESWAGVARCTAAFSFAITGQWDRAWETLDPNTPFPLDAPWYLYKYYFKALFWLTGRGAEIWGAVLDWIWAGVCWLYEVGVWIVENAPWIIAGFMTILVLLLVPIVWSRFFKVVWGLIKFGWILARDGAIAASEFADTFWKDFVATSYVKKLAGAVPVSRVAKATGIGKVTKRTIISPIKKKR